MEKKDLKKGQFIMAYTTREWELVKVAKVNRVTVDVIIDEHYDFVERVKIVNVERLDAECVHKFKIEYKYCLEGIQKLEPGITESEILNFKWTQTGPFEAIVSKAQWLHKAIEQYEKEHAE